MSGHSKWHSIKHKKGALDAQRGKIFTRHAKLIAIAARNGGDVDSNPSLRAAIDNAKADNVPNMNIDRAVKKGSGQGKDAVAYEEIFYEGFGPRGIAVYIHAITDNRNRASSELKTVLSRHGGGMGATGSSSWIFDKKGLITIPLANVSDLDELEMKIIDAGADDIKKENDYLDVYTNFASFAQVRANLLKMGVKIESGEITYIPKQTVKITDEDEARKVLNMIESLEENDDVNDVFANFDIDDEIIEKLA